MSPLHRKLRQTSYSHEEKLGPAKLYLDDIDDLMKLLREVSEEKRQEYMRESPMYLTRQQEESEEGRKEEGNKTKNWQTLPKELQESRERLVTEGRKAIAEGRKATDDWLKRQFRVELTVGDAVADEADDLRDAAPKDLSSVHISLMNPPIWITLGTSYAKVSAYSDRGDAFIRGVVDDIVRVVNRRRVWLLLSFATVLSLLGAVAWFALSALSILKGYPPEQSVSLILLGTALVAFAL